MGKVKEIINQVKECAEDVYAELGSDWHEGVYQKAMEVSLRLKRVEYESQRMLPVSYRGHFVGWAVPDLIVWGGGIAVIVELKQGQGVREGHRRQVAKYIEALKWQVGIGKVSNAGLVLNFPSTADTKVSEGELEKVGGAEMLVVTSRSPAGGLAGSEDELEYIQRCWGDFVNFCHNNRDNLDALLRGSCKPVSVEGDVLVLGFRRDGFRKRNLEKPTYKQALEENLMRMFGKRYDVRYIVTGEEESYD